MLIISPPKPSNEGEKAIAEGQPFSEQFCKAVSGVADEIESLRAVVLKKDMQSSVRDLTKSTTSYRYRQFMSKRTQIWPFTKRCRMPTISLAIICYKQSRGVPSQEPQNPSFIPWCAQWKANLPS